MIKLTLLGKQGREFYLNPHVIESIEIGGADLIIHLLSGKSFMVAEDIQTVQKRIVTYRKEIGCFKNEE
ncbi:flagellar FlbD family protein [Entomospira culicis]|uniref:Flagellar protein FlbD n=1 Tax=Entomospira culicis TaxID=2719989 RepID=A0A968GFT7_9SPIO|nr:flagellar FlbD family protein [Entomospira culicis]NIZ19387.1 flagellar protein FlbD [Entomospira culicis]NIZ69708.1 flagellar protein FlbD [Entomospira culicis]WDI36818.1 flagellar FlbD family protein [Entomospira culicis]WDI38447.1 flagellar FlbD family protein [Entomospira culicis]